MSDIYTENGPKTKFGKIMKIIVILVVLALYCLLFFRLFVSCNSSLVETLIFNDRIKGDYCASVLGIKFPILAPENKPGIDGESVAAQPFLVYEYSPVTTMDSEGRVQTRYCTYIEKTHDLQVTVKMNASYYEPGDNFSNYYFTLRQVSGNSVTEHEVGFFDSDGNSKYRFFRLDFEGVTVKDGDQLSLVMYHNEDTPRRILSIKLFGIATAAIEDNTTVSTTSTTAISTEVTDDGNNNIFTRQLNTIELKYKII